MAVLWSTVVSTMVSMPLITSVERVLKAGQPGSVCQEPHIRAAKHCPPLALRVGWAEPGVQPVILSASNKCQLQNMEALKVSAGWTVPQGAGVVTTCTCLGYWPGEEGWQPKDFRQAAMAIPMSVSQFQVPILCPFLSFPCFPALVALNEG